MVDTATPLDNYVSAFLTLITACFTNGASKIAISNHRIKAIDKVKKTVTFSAKDYRKGGQKNDITLSCKDFIKRFSLHILPKGFTRIRHYGILSSSWKKIKLPALQEMVNKRKVSVVADETPITHHKRCPTC